MKGQNLFSRKNKKNSISLSSAEFAQRVVKVKGYFLLFSSLLWKYQTHIFSGKKKETTCTLKCCLLADIKKRYGTFISEGCIQQLLECIAPDKIICCVAIFVFWTKTLIFFLFLRKKYSYFSIKNVVSTNLTCLDEALPRSIDKGFTEEIREKHSSW